MTVKHLLDQKGRNLWTIDPDATVLDALAKMAEKDIGSLVVMDGEELIGIITERHYSRNVILKGKTSPTTLVRKQRNPCPARTIGRAMYGSDDREACASSTGARRQKSDWHYLHRRFAQGYNF
jgi:CBS-domain-containing membrane protein